MESTETVGVNRQYKDRLFCDIFGAEENKKWLLSLYNAMNHSEYTDISDLKINTLDDVIYTRMKNDVSFVFHSEMTLFEQQSSYNPNMPLRGFLYFAQLLGAWLEETGSLSKIYGTTLVSLPNPNYIVFYNGTKDTPDKEDMKLSDAFESTDKTGRYEWTAQVYNINAGHNEELLNVCRPLRDYSDFVNKVKENLRNGKKTKEAVTQAVDWAIEQNLLDGYFKRKGSEVIQMALTEFNELEYTKMVRDEGEAKGKAEGVKEGGNLKVYELVSKSLLSPEDGANNLHITINELKNRMALCGYVFPTHNK